METKVNPIDFPVDQPIPFDQTCILGFHATYGMTHWRSSQAFYQYALKENSPFQGRLHQGGIPTSFDSHNVMMVAALNAQENKTIPVTHLFIMHNDIVPAKGFLDILLEEMYRTNCDLLGVVAPIKDMNGLTSTAIDSYDTPFLVHRRLTMTEVHRLPETFTAADAGYPDRNLLVNTGLILVNFTRPWRKLLNEDGSLKLNITSFDRIRRRESDGAWESQHAPSDWHFSREVARMGGKVMATRKVVLNHMGDLPYRNDQPWGEWETDKALEHKHNNVWVGDTSVTIGTTQITVEN